MTPENNLETIQRLHQEVQSWFLISVPGFSCLVTGITCQLASGHLDQVISALSRNTLLPDNLAGFLLTYTIPFVAWWLPFRQAERSMSRLKTQIRKHGENPVKYTPIDRLISKVPLTSDNSPLPFDRNHNPKV